MAAWSENEKFVRVRFFIWNYECLPLSHTHLMCIKMHKCSTWCESIYALLLIWILNAYGLLLIDWINTKHTEKMKKKRRHPLNTNAKRELFIFHMEMVFFCKMPLIHLVLMRGLKAVNLKRLAKWFFSNKYVY